MIARTVAIVGEDIRFVLFLEAAIDSIARGAGRVTRLLSAEKTGGCRTRVFQETCRRIEPLCDLIVVGADSRGAGHSARNRTYRQKRGALARLLPSAASPKCVLAVADPSVEAWLVCDRRAFGEGLGAALGAPFLPPAHWPVPRSEREAKDYLGKLVREGTGGKLPLGGFEFAAEIIGRMSLQTAPNRSLSEWAKDLARRI